jgi:hypothetical protein
VIGAGTYSESAALSFSGKRWLIGSAPTLPILTRSTPGPIISLSGGVEASFERVQISGATSANNDGYGVYAIQSGGSPTLIFRDAVVRQNSEGGLNARTAKIDAQRSHFDNNGRYGIEIVDGNATFDRCTFNENAGGLYVDSGILTLTNSLIARNYNPATNDYGLYLYSTSPGHRVEFNTIVDNSDGSTLTLGVGFACELTGVSASFPNNIIARNKRQVRGTNCSYPSSIVIDTDIAPLNFKSPDAAPYDYHLQAGSIAIDAATASTIDHDFDGDVRPNGTVRDVGADEFVP